MTRLLHLPWPARVALAGGLLVVLWTQPWTSAQETNKMKADLAALDKKLKDVVATQHAILEKLSVIVEELQVVKVRCTK